MPEDLLVSAPPAPSQAKPSPTGRRRWRIAFRWLRILILLLILGLVVLGLYLNQVGLPGPLKTQAAARLRAQGWNLDFSRLRLHWYRGIVAEDISLEYTNAVSGPRLFSKLAECRFDPGSLFRLRFELRALTLEGARALFPLPGTNRPERLLRIEEISGELAFDERDVWQLRSLRGRTLGTKIQLSGSITNGSVLREWKLARGEKGGRPLARWSRWVEVMEQHEFLQPPEIVANFHGDARDLPTFQAGLRVILPAVESPWLRASNVWLSAQLLPPPSAHSSAYAMIRLKTDQAATPWAGTGKLDLECHFEPAWSNTWFRYAQGKVEIIAPKSNWGQSQSLRAGFYYSPDPDDPSQRLTELRITATNLVSDWFSASNAAAALVGQHSGTNLWPSQVQIKAGAEQAGTRWGDAVAARANGQFVLPPIGQLRLFETNLAWPARWEKIPFQGSLNVTSAQLAQLEVGSLHLTTQWQPAKLMVDATAELAGGGLTAHGELDAAIRQLAFHGQTRFDLQKITPLLRTNTQRWITNYSWKTPPHFNVRGRVTLPEWTNRQPDWKQDVVPTLALEGRFDIREGAYRGVPCSRAQSSFIFTNQTWFLPDLVITRPEGTVKASYREHARTRDFSARLHSTIDPKALQPAVRSVKAQRAFDFVRFTAPPVIEGQVWGRWRQHDRLGVDARIAATNLVFRGEQVKDAVARLIYTNQVVTILEPQIQREGEKGTATVISIDIAQRKVYLTNAFGNLNPYAVTRAISQKTAKAIEPYVYQSSPTIRVNGIVDTRKGGPEDELHFEVSGGPFRWRKFRFQELAGNVDWVGRTVTLSNVHGRLYGGRVTGAAAFEVVGPDRSHFSFEVAAAQTDLHQLMADIATRTNKLEGLLSGKLNVTSAHLTNAQSWQGYGYVELHDGLIWEIPIFGVFSPILDTIMPGLGHSRAKQGTANFTITNSVIHTDDLEIRAATMRMQYRGKVEFDGGVDGRAEAELLRDLPAVGFLVSKVFWPLTKLFEYRISGTLNRPKTEPVYIIPKLLLLPFNPVKGVKEIFAIEEDAPAKKKPPSPQPR